MSIMPAIGTRRGVLAKTVALSAGLFAAAAARSEPAHAIPQYCCTLATNIQCSGVGLNWYCPSGYTKRWWNCCYSGQVYMCGECTTAATCWNGPFACSYATPMRAGCS